MMMAHVTMKPLRSTASAHVMMMLTEMGFVMLTK